MIKLGDTVRDSISGFEGVATARAEYLHNTPAVQVTGKVYDPAKGPVSQWIDEARLTTLAPAA